MGRTAKEPKKQENSSPLLTGLISIVTVLGSAAVLLAAIERVGHPDYNWVPLFVLAFFVGPLATIYIPGLKARVVLGDVVTFACAALFGPGAAVLTAFADGLATSLKMTRDLRKLIFNIGMCTVSTATASWVTMALFPGFGRTPVQLPLLQLIEALGLFTFCYFAMSTALIAAYISLSLRRSVFQVWNEDLLWTSISCVASGASAVVVCLLVERFGYTILVAPAALTVLVFLFYRTYFQKVESANQRAEIIEEQLRQSQKMEAIGRLAGGVAHDFNNLLTAILGYSDFLLFSLKDEDPLREHVLEIKKAGERAGGLTRQLLAFSRKQLLQPKIVDLNVVVADMNRMLGRLIGEDIDLVVQLDPALGHVKADPGQLEQVIMNLAVNARDAMPEGGKLTIQTRNLNSEDEGAGEVVGGASGPWVVLSISDTGCGMSKELQSHIFEPFFTTKETGKGTGLGLSTVYGIIKQSGGHIAVASRPGKGAIFNIYLPRTVETLYGGSSEKSHWSTTAISETLLLVEDEEVVRKLVSEILRLNGYEVLQASNGHDALKVCEQHAGQIHLMVTDVVMPNMSGRQLAERAAHLRPEMKVLYVSGYTEDEIVRHGVSNEGVNFLQKPFSPDVLSKKVREILGVQHNPRSRPIVEARVSEYM